MRRLSLAGLLLLAGCATAPPAPRPAPAPAAPAEPGSRLSGLTQAELVRRFGAPGFQVSEGTALKLQWQSASCVLDAYLYPPAGGGSGAPTVLHVDSRRPGGGEDVGLDACLATFPAAAS